MLDINIIIKAITLLNRENVLGDQMSDNSRELIKILLNSANSNSGNFYNGGDSDIIENLKHLLRDMVDNPDNYDQVTLLQSLELILKDKETLLKTIDKAINVELSVPSLKRTIISLRNTLNNYYKEQEIKSVISKTSYAINTNNLGDKSIIELAEVLITNLDALTTVSKTKDPGIVDEIDIDNDDVMDSVIDRAKTQSDTSGRMRTGWIELNEMLGGGFRRGETVVTLALQHNYKSGLVQSLFMQLAMLNTPDLLDTTKKPLMLLISFEDDAEIMLNFMYKYLYYNEHGKAPDLTGMTTNDVTRYIKDKLKVNGYHIKILRVNPSEWTYKHLFNKVLEYEANGFELHVCVIDYLEKLPTTGCINTGAMGTDLRDLFNRCRNFFSSKRVLFITPHQMSTEAKQLTRNGVPPQNLVKDVANKGYYSGSKQIDQVVDLEIYQHIAFIKRKPYLTIQRGKRRFPEIIDEDKKYFMLEFPYKAPIPSNVNNANYVKVGAISNDDNTFNF